MSAQDFQSAFQEYLSKVGTYNTAQRTTLLNAFKSAVNETLSAIGAPLPEPSPTAAAAPAAAAPAATPAKAAAPTADNKAAAGSSVTGAKPSSRVNQNPGGTSSINLGGGDDRPVTHGGRKQMANANASTIQFGAADDASKTSVKVHHAPGGGSSIQLGDDSTPTNAAAPKRMDRLDDVAAHPKKPHGRKQLAPADGNDIFNQKTDDSAKTSVKVHHAPGGGSNLSLAHDSAPAKAEAKVDAAAAGNGTDVSAAQLKEIIAAVYRKGKVKDTFTKFTGNKGKVMSTAELKEGVQSLGINGFTDAQAASLMARFAADVKVGMSYPEFMKMMSA